MSGPHAPVLLAEVVEALEPASGKTIVDGTFGAGGYSRAFLERGARVIAFGASGPESRGVASPAAGEFRVTTSTGQVTRYRPAEQTSEVLAEGSPQTGPRSRVRGVRSPGEAAPATGRASGTGRSASSSRRST